MIPTIIKTEDTSSQTKTTINEVPDENESSDLFEEEVEETIIVKVTKRTRISRTPSPRASPRVERHAVHQNGHDEVDKIESNIIINEIQDGIDSSNLRIQPKAEVDERQVFINKLNGELESIQYSQQNPKSTKNLDLNLEKPNESGMRTSRDAAKDEDTMTTKAKNCCFSCLSLCALLDDCFTCRGSAS